MITASRWPYFVSQKSIHLILCMFNVSRTIPNLKLAFRRRVRPDANDPRKQAHRQYKTRTIFVKQWRYAFVSICGWRMFTYLIVSSKVCNATSVSKAVTISPFGPLASWKNKSTLSSVLRASRFPLVLLQDHARNSWCHRWNCHFSCAVAHSDIDNYS